jgi:hypothetical protein
MPSRVEGDDSEEERAPNQDVEDNQQDYQDQQDQLDQQDQEEFFSFFEEDPQDHTENPQASAELSVCIEEEHGTFCLCASRF